jgi:hypothetical protein
MHGRRPRINTSSRGTHKTTEAHQESRTRTSALHPSRTTAMIEDLETLSQEVRRSGTVAQQCEDLRVEFAQLQQQVEALRWQLVRIR